MGELRLRYGFVIDHNRCIGCHACTVACKEEHNVPVGVFRTWVKYIEKGEFPDTSRHFGVMRCNHCDAAPCIEICPTRALFRRDDGIVDFDNSRCIGCKSCMQACPYDALYIDPNSNTAAKCNFCAHRVELNLEPACVIVCPTQAIIAGDLDDPQSNISRRVATQKVAARKPQKGTKPKLFYAGIEGDFLQPSMMEAQPAHMFAEQNPRMNPHNAIPTYNGRGAPGRARAVYDVAHPQPWGWIPALYLWTKSIAGGVLILAGLFSGLRLGAGASAAKLFAIAAPALALAFLAITTVLLIADLKRWDRFYYILIKPNPRSWLMWGTWILILTSVAAASWLVFAVLGRNIPSSLVWIAPPLGLASACYSAFLFAQAKGRDLWQSPLFLWHLAIQAVMAGAAALLLLSLALNKNSPAATAILWIMIFALVVHAFMMLSEVSMPSPSEDVHHAVYVMTHGTVGKIFWLAAITGGTLIPLVLSILAITRTGPMLLMQIAAAFATLLGLLAYEYVWITAGQAPPLS
ncbi:MAG TPA: 4Fe-4S dicluster domain-containing protein [Candidatus Binataceae bacterium]|nr:4Fe-4S dicluster domain-containing protein [Candidatus Binataceae bacterium]